MVVAEFKNDNYTSVYGLKQWDFGQELLIKGTGIQGKTVEVHFALERDDVALRMLGTIENGNITVLIPDTLLQIGNSIYAYVYQSGETAGKTTHKIFMHVSPRAKPEDYTEKEFKNALQQVLAIAQSVREDADAGKFNATDEQIRKVVETYMSNHPIEKIETDKTLSIEGKAADAKATGDKILQYAIKNTVTGESPVAITDSAEEKLQDLKLFGRTEQVTTKGVNLIPFPYVDKDMTKNGVTFTVKEDGGIKVYGTSSENVIFTLAVIDYGTESIFNNSIGNGKIISGGKDNVSIEYHGVTKKTYLSIAGGKAVNTIIYPQLEKGSVATPYEPYTGEKPSPSPEFPQEIKNVGKYNSDTGKYEVDVKIIGKNLFNLTNNFILGYFNITPNSKIIGYRDNAIVYIPCNPNTTYTVSGCKRKPTNTYRRYKVGETYEFPEVNTEVFNVKEVKLEEPIAFTTSSRAKYLIISAVGDSEVNIEDPMEEVLKRNVSEMMVEISDTPTKYEQYKEQTVKLSLDQPLRGIGEHKDEVTKDGVVRRIKQIVWNGSENWSLSNSNLIQTNKFYLPKVDDAYSAYRKISSLVDALPFVADENSDELGQRFYLGNPMINLDKEQFPNVDTLKKYLSENPMTVQYALAEPIIEPLPEEFEQILKLNSYYPTTVISTYGGEVDPGVEVTYVADTKNYLDNKVSTNVANIISQYQTNLANLLSLMPIETQATMIENDTNNILESEVTQ